MRYLHPNLEAKMQGVARLAADCDNSVTVRTRVRQLIPKVSLLSPMSMPSLSSSPWRRGAVAQSQVLHLEGSARTEDRRQSCEECLERNEHSREL